MRGRWARDGIGGFSHESEHDLGLMVNDFLENGSAGTDHSRHSSDSESSLSDLAHLADNISHYNRTVDQYESLCNASCIKFSLVKLLRNSGYDAGVCASKWRNCGKVPGGDHEYIDVVTHCDGGISERFIIDIDFRSHFEIARAVEYYDIVLGSLPVVFVGYPSKLKQFLQVMVEAARSSLKQNSMPLPPWRSLAYLQAKWHSTYHRKLNPDKQMYHDIFTSVHSRCLGHLWRLKSSLQSEIEAERLLKPLKSDGGNRKLKLESPRRTSIRCL